MRRKTGGGRRLGGREGRGGRGGRKHKDEDEDDELMKRRTRGLG